ncbi:MAG: hypothetical protein DME75_03480 [Verrucomicrobia bacterium]|nr:MAG: hypothetical protein DME75_03480 [Verrucomicrobiota bacterium]
MNDHRHLDKMRSRRRLHHKKGGSHIIMNNEYESTYTLLVRSEEKGRSIMETVVYALFGLSAIISIWQFVEQPNRLPIDAPTPDRYVAPQISHHQAGSGVNRGS